MEDLFNAESLEEISNGKSSLINFDIELKLYERALKFIA